MLSTVYWSIQIRVNFFLRNLKHCTHIEWNISVSVCFQFASKWDRMLKERLQTLNLPMSNKEILVKQPIYCLYYFLDGQFQYSNEHTIKFYIPMMYSNHYQKIYRTFWVIDSKSLFCWWAQKLHFICDSSEFHLMISFFFRFRKWQSECKINSKPSLFRAVLKAFWPEYLYMGVLNAIIDLFAPLIIPFLLERFLSFFR